MTDPLTRERLWELANEAEGPCVSVYLPTHPALRPERHGAVRLRSLLRSTRKSLTPLLPIGLDLHTRLDGLQALVQDRRFWTQQSMGLALFISPHRCCWYRVPISLGETAVIGPRFHLKPLLPLLGESARFFILAVNQSRVRFLECMSATLIL